MFFIEYAFKGHVHVFAGQVKVVNHSSCRTSAIFKYFCPLNLPVIFLQALASAMDEEDSLTNELVKEQDQALETAIQEEETWLKELAREENLVIEVETENEESDLAVSFFFCLFFY